MKSRSTPRPLQRKPGGRKWRPKTIGSRFASLAEQVEAEKLAAANAKFKVLLKKKPWKPNRWDKEFVERCMSYGLTQKQVCQLIEDRYGFQIDDETLRHFFARQIEIGAHKSVTTIADKLYAKAMKGSVAAMTFYLKTKGRWSQTLQLADPSGRPLQPPKVSVHFGDNPDEEDEDDKG